MVLWQQGRRSTNVEDMRGAEGPRRLGGVAKMGGGGALVLVVIAVLLGKDPSQLLSMLTGGGPSTEPQRPVQASQAEEQAKDFVSVMLADTEDTWGSLFSQMGSRYVNPKLVLFRDVVQSACGMAESATGPFYCPKDQKVYLDLGFLEELKNLGANGDFAVAYVIAHEVGHHVQYLLGTERKVRQQQEQGDGEAGADSLSVRTELQADCYAGVWAFHAQRQRHILEQGDVEEGLNAAASIGDDRLQKMAGRAVNPDAFTHGTSKQRTAWFQTGFKTGSVQACDTFANPNP
jgi:uncharacterized protein